MTCANCTALREELRKAQRELGLRRRDGAIGALMHRLRLEPMGAIVTLDLYEAGGRCVSHETLVANSGMSRHETLKSHIYRIRGVLGDDAIVTFPSIGYALSAVGVSMVLAAIEPPGLQDVRLTEAVP